MKMNQDEIDASRRLETGVYNGLYSTLLKCDDFEDMYAMLLTFSAHQIDAIKDDKREFAMEFAYMRLVTAYFNLRRKRGDRQDAPFMSFRGDLLRELNKVHEIATTHFKQLEEGNEDHN